MIKYVNLHAHSCYSMMDGLGYPPEHIDAAIEKGLNAHAITDHGNMNGFVSQYLHTKSLKEKGKDFKNIYGVEAYYVNSLSEWRRLFDESKEEKKKKKEEEAVEGSTSVEDEEESRKEAKNSSPLRRRHHIVLLAQNQVGLSNLFKIVSESYENFYYYPRIDFEILKKYNEGIIVSTACLSGILSAKMYQYADFGEEKIVEEIAKEMEKFQKVFGDRFFAEIQFNNVEDQKFLNKYIVNAANKTGTKIIVGGDCHFPKKEQWKDREIYKRLGWLNMSKDPELLKIPDSLEDMKYSLYVKNGDDIFEEYKKYMNDSFYKDEEIISYIERTYDIAHNLIEEINPDTNVKFPSFIESDDEKAMAQIKEMCFKRLDEIKKSNEKYISRLNHEISVIEDRNFGTYFLTQKMICDTAREHMLSCPGRGSAAGSLIAYLLQITQIDPVKYGLQFERFLRAGESFGFNFDGASGSERKVAEAYEIFDENGKKIILTPNIEVKIKRNEEIKKVCVKDLMEGDEIL